MSGTNSHTALALIAAIGASALGCSALESFAPYPPQQDGGRSRDADRDATHDSVAESQAKACTPSPCINGGICNTLEAGAYSCTCGGGYSGRTCEMPPPYCDVVYRLNSASPSAQTTLRVANTGTYQLDAMHPVGDNTTAATCVVSPLTPCTFPRGFMRLRFTATGGAPAAGPVQLIEYFVPLQFVVPLYGTTVTSNLSYSTGLLQLVTSGCPTLNYAECLPPEQAEQTLDRVCKSHGSGVVAGTTLSWSACDLTPPAPPAMNPSSVPDWTQDDSQVPPTMLSMNPGCIEAVSLFGNVSCTGDLCGVAPPGSLGVQNGTWDQKWDSFTFSSTDYATATVAMAQTTIPSPANTYISLTFEAAAPIAVQCGTAESLSCNVE
jgi:hypothetical protein